MAVGNGRYFVTADDPAVAVSCMSAGTAFVGQVENQIALGGATRFVILNTAGGFGPDIAVGDLAVVETAVRDDGISDHYLAPGDTVDADESLTETLLPAARSVQPHARRHTSWTIPAVFRQTQQEVDHCIDQGISVVESEIAALLAVCQARNVRAGAIVTVMGVEPPLDDAPADWSSIAATQWDVFEAVIGVLQIDLRSNALVQRNFGIVTISPVGEDDRVSLNPPSQYATESNLRARQRLWEQQRPKFDIVGWVLEVAGLGPTTHQRVLDVGCGNVDVSP